MSGPRVALALLAAAAVAALSIFGLASTGSPHGGRVAPALPRETLVGRPVTLLELIDRAGKRPVAVVFWASWCGPCEREAPALERFSRSAAGRGRIVAVDWNDGSSGAKAFVRRYRWTFPVVRDAEGTVGADYRLTGLPMTFVVDGKGRISATLRGPQTERSLTEALGG